MESIEISYQAERCTVHVERIYEDQKPLKELLLELVKKQMTPSLQA